MAVAFVRSHVPEFVKSAGTNDTYATTSIVAAGNTLVAVFVHDNAASANTPVISSISKPGNEPSNWVMLGRATHASAATAGAFANGEMWVIQTTVAWPNATSLTVAYSTTITMKAQNILEFSGVEASPRSVSGQNYSTTTTAASAATTGTTPAIGDLALGFIFGSNVAAAQAGDTDTTGGSWSTPVGVGSTGSSAATNNYGIAQYKVLTAASAQTLNNSAAMTAGNGAIVAILQATPDPTVTQAAYRWYEEGTESGAVPYVAQDTAVIGDISNGDATGTLRIRLQSTNATPLPATDDWQLQYKRGGDEYDVSNINPNVNASLYATYPQTAQSFIANGGRLERATFYLAKNGSPTGTVAAALWAHDGGTFGGTGLPTGAPLATSTTSVTASALTTSKVATSFTFDGTFPLVTGTSYFIGLIATGGTSSSSNTVHVGADDTPTHPGKWAGYTAGAWSVQPYDLIFEVNDWVNVTASSAAAATYDSPNLTNGGATTSRLTGGTGTFVAGKVSEDSLMDDLGFGGNNHTELVYALKIKAADVAQGDTLRFRVLRNGATTGMTYSQVPTINLVKNVQVTASRSTTWNLSVATFTIGAYRFYADGTESASTPLAAQDTPPTVSLLSADANIQLRLRVTNPTGIASGVANFILQWEKNASGVWNPVALGTQVEGLTGGTSTRTLDTTTHAQAQSFIGTGVPLRRVAFNHSNSFAVDGVLRAALYAHSGTFGASDSIPTGSPLAISTVVYTKAEMSSLPSISYYYDFDGTVTLNGGTPYFIAIEQTGITSGSYTVVAQFNVPTNRHPGVLASRSNTGVWTYNGTYDLCFTVLAVTPVEVMAHFTANIPENAFTSNRLGTSPFSFTGKVGRDGDASTGSLNAGANTEVLYTITLSKDVLAHGDTLRFRLISTSDGSSSNITHTQVPTVGITKTTGVQVTASRSTTWGVSGRVTGTRATTWNVAAPPVVLIADINPDFTNSGVWQRHGSVTATASKLIFPASESVLYYSRTIAKYGWDESRVFVKVSQIASDRVFSMVLSNSNDPVDSVNTYAVNVGGGQVYGAWHKNSTPGSTSFTSWDPAKPYISISNTGSTTSFQRSATGQPGTWETLGSTTVENDNPTLYLLLHTEGIVDAVTPVWVEDLNTAGATLTQVTASRATTWLVNLPFSPPLLNHVAIKMPRTGTNTNWCDPATSGTVGAGTRFTPTAGRLLLCYAEGPITTSTPSGWTLPSTGDAVGNTGLYVFWKTASGNDTFGTSGSPVTHNGTGFPMVFHFMEFSPDCVFLGSASANNINPNTGAGSPVLTGLSDANYVMHVGAQNGVEPIPFDAVWSNGTELVQVTEVWAGYAGGDGYLYSLAIEPAVTTPTSTSVMTSTYTNPIPTLERLTVGVKQTVGTTQVTASRATTWKVGAYVTQTKAAIYTVLARQSQTKATTWHVRAYASATRATTYAVRFTVAVSTRSTSWSVGSSITSTRATAWVVQAQVSNPRPTSWVVRALATALRPTTWAIQAQPTATRSTTWNVAGPTGQVTATRVARWNFAPWINRALLAVSVSGTPYTTFASGPTNPNFDWVEAGTKVFTPTVGNTLVVVVTTIHDIATEPVGWTKPTNGEATAFDGVSGVWTNIYQRTATGSDNITLIVDSALGNTVAHFDFYEFPAGQGVAASVKEDSAAYTGDPGPSLDMTAMGLTGTYSIFYVASSPNQSTLQRAWWWTWTPDPTGDIEDNWYRRSSTNPGWGYGIAYNAAFDPNSGPTSLTANSNNSAEATIARLVFAVGVPLTQVTATRDTTWGVRSQTTDSRATTWNVTTLPPVASITPDFTSPDWTKLGVATATTTRLSFALNVNDGNGKTPNLYRLAESRLFFRIAELTGIGTTAGISLGRPGSDHYYQMDVYDDGSTYIYWDNGPNGLFSPGPAWDPAKPVLSMRQTGGTVYCERSATGAPGTWETLWTGDASTELGPATTVNIFASNYSGLGTVVYDYFNTVAPARVTATRSTSWAVHTPATASRATTWAAPAQITATRSTSWTAAVSIALATRPTSWATKTLITAVRPTTWTAAVSIALATRPTTWAVLTPVTAVRPTNWAVTSRQTATRPTTWHTLVPVTAPATRLTSWKALAPATNPRPTTWAVLAPVAAVSARATSYAVKAQATNTRPTTWAVKSITTATRATSWAVRFEHVTAASLAVTTTTTTTATRTGLAAPTALAVTTSRTAAATRTTYAAPTALAVTTMATAVALRAAAPAVAALAVTVSLAATAVRTTYVAPTALAVTTSVTATSARVTAVPTAVQVVTTTFAAMAIAGTGAVSVLAITTSLSATVTKATTAALTSLPVVTSRSAVIAKTTFVAPTALPVTTTRTAAATRTTFVTGTALAVTTSRTAAAVRTAAPAAAALAVTTTRTATAVRAAAPAAAALAVTTTLTAAAVRTTFLAATALAVTTSRSAAATRTTFVTPAGLAVTTTFTAVTTRTTTVVTTTLSVTTTILATTVPGAFVGAALAVTTSRTAAATRTTFITTTALAVTTSRVAAATRTTFVGAVALAVTTTRAAAAARVTAVTTVSLSVVTTIIAATTPGAAVTAVALVVTTTRTATAVRTTFVSPVALTVTTTMSATIALTLPAAPVTLAITTSAAATAERALLVPLVALAVFTSRFAELVVEAAAAGWGSVVVGELERQVVGRWVIIGGVKHPVVGSSVIVSEQKKALV